MKSVTIFTDGSCLGNPGSGGWGAILRYGTATRECSGGFALTTNNRMEIMAAIMALESLKEPCQVDLYTDSQYVRNAVEKGWLSGWLKNGWKTAAKKPVKNQDLWIRLHAQLQGHNVVFKWIRAHAGHTENERCDTLAKAQAALTGLPRDMGFEEGETTC